jgi:O-antigen/teichoic acid export membrane protein
VQVAVRHVLLRSGARRIRGPLAVSFGTSTSIQGLAIVTGVLLARTLGPHGRGALAAVQLWPAMLAALGSLGIPESLTYFAARRRTSPGTLICTALGIVAVQSVVLVGIGAAVLPLLLPSSPGVRIAGFAYLAFIPLNLAILAVASTLNGLQRPRTYQALRLLVVVLNVAAVVGLTVGSVLSVLTMTLAYLAGSVVVLAVAVLTIRAAIAGDPLRFDAAVGRDMLVFGVKSHVGSVSSLMNERLDQLVIAVLLSPAQLGLYVVAVTLTSATTLVGSSVALVALPRLAALTPSRAARETRRLVALTLGVSALVTAPLVVLAPWLVGFFFGSAFSGAVPACRVLLLAAVALSLNRALSAMLTGLGRPVDSGVGELLALVCTVVLLATLLPALGLLGAAVASLVAYLVSAIWMGTRMLHATSPPRTSSGLELARAAKGGTA